MTDDHQSPGPLRPLRQAVDLLVLAPVGFVVDLVTHPSESLDHLQAHAHRTLRAFGIGTTSDEARGPLPDELLVDDEATVAADTGAAPAAAAAPVQPIKPTAVAGATVVNGIAVRVPTQPVHPPAPPSSDPDGLAIPGYDSLSASQVVPRLESLSADELDEVRRYELANRGRKTILSKIAQLQT